MEGQSGNAVTEGQAMEANEECIEFCPKPETESKDETVKEDREESDKIPRKVYLAHALSTWGDRMWLFVGGVYMMALDPSDLRLTATYGLLIAATNIVFGASLGSWIDRKHRLTAARWCLVVQNVSVCACAVLLASYFATGQEGSVFGSPTKLAFLATVIGLACSAALASAGTTIVLQKDWIVAIAKGNTNWLARTNSVLRTIELTSYVVAPALAGQLFSLLGYVWTAAFVAAWNVVSVVVEFFLLEVIYRSYPVLQEKAVLARTRKELKARGEGTCEEVAPMSDAVFKNKEKNKKRNGFVETYKGWKTYFFHPVRNAGLGLALLYLTVLGLDNITFGYVLTQGVSEATLGALVAVSAAVGVSGSVAFTIIRSHVGLERTALFGLFLLVAPSSAALASMFLPGSSALWNRGDAEEQQKLVSVGMFLSGIIVARFGLWVTDLSINQIIQERVEEERRGVFNGVQNSLNNSLDLFKCVLVIALPRPEQFGILVVISFASISLGWLSFASYSRKQRGHILPFHNFCRLAAHSLDPAEIHRIPTIGADMDLKEGGGPIVKKKRDMVV